MSSYSNVKSVYEHIIRIRQRYLADVTGNLLDHGFGNGILSRYFIDEGFDVYGVELERSEYRDFLLEGKVVPSNFKFIPTDERAIPFPDSFFNVVVSNQVLNFLPGREHIDGTITEFARILKPGGKVVATVMSEDNYLFTDYGIPSVPAHGLVHVKVSGRIDRDRIYYRFKNSGDIVSSFKNAGFVVDDLGYFDFKLLDVRCAKHYIILAHKK